MEEEEEEEEDLLELLGIGENKEGLGRSVLGVALIIDCVVPSGRCSQFPVKRASVCATVLKVVLYLVLCVQVSGMHSVCALLKA